MTTSFASHTESIETQSLELDVAEIPWDSSLLSAPVAEIRRIKISDPKLANRDYEAFLDWCADRHIVFCSCRLAQDRTQDACFLQRHGFYFIELNYRPELRDLSARTYAPTGIRVHEAAQKDAPILADMAEQTIQYGRFHQDPWIGAPLGRKRYRQWLLNAFTIARQQVLVCTSGGVIVAFFVVEHAAPDRCFWSLIGFSPQVNGSGLGTRVWQSMLAYHRRKGVDIVSTSISSHNVPVMNLYVKLGFRFPEPSITLHWHRDNPFNTPAKGVSK